MIALSAGHHPKAVGAESGARTEHAEASKWVGRIASILSPTHAVTIVPTGTLTEKVAAINALHAQQPVAIAVEIHFNSDPKRAGRGCETLYCPNSVAGKAAADVIQGALAPIFAPNRGVKPGWYRMDRPGHVDFVGDVDGDEKVDYFLKATNPVALILEPCFIHQHSELDNMWQTGCAVIAQSLIELVSQ